MKESARPQPLLVEYARNVGPPLRGSNEGQLHEGTAPLYRVTATVTAAVRRGRLDTGTGPAADKQEVAAVVAGGAGADGVERQPGPLLADVGPQEGAAGRGLG